MGGGMGGMSGSIPALGALGALGGLFGGGKDKKKIRPMKYSSPEEVDAVLAKNRYSAARSGMSFGMTGGGGKLTPKTPSGFSYGMWMPSLANLDNRNYEPWTSPITSRQRQTQSYTKYVTDSVLTRAMNPTLSGSSIDKLVEMYQTRETRMQGPSIPERHNWYGGFRALAQHGSSHLLEQGLSKMYKTKKTNTGAARRVTRKAL